MISYGVWDSNAGETFKGIRRSVVMEEIGQWPIGGPGGKLSTSSWAADREPTRQGQSLMRNDASAYCPLWCLALFAPSGNIFLRTTF
jgi:hypothetical protein